MANGLQNPHVMYCLVRRSLRRIVSAAFIAVTLANPAFAQNSKTLHGHVVPPTRGLNSLGALPETDRLSLVLGVPLRNQAELENLLRDLHDPASSRFHQWLTPEEFTANFAPTAVDYD